MNELRMPITQAVICVFIRFFMASLKVLSVTISINFGVTR